MCRVHQTYSSVNVQLQLGRRKPQGRGTGSRGVENTGAGEQHRVLWKTRGLVENMESSGKHGVWWKTRGLVENTAQARSEKHGGPLFLLISLNCNENHSASRRQRLFSNIS